MNKLIVVLAFFLLLTITGYGGGDKLRFVDTAGRPIPGVTVSVSFTYTPPALPGGSGGSAVSDANGLVSINHPCFTTGSCCSLVQGTYSIRKQGLRFSHTEGRVTCSPVVVETVITGTDLPNIVSVSAASYYSPLTSEMITAAFGANLASATESATLPLKTTLGGRSILVRDSKGMEKAALLLLISPGQINYIVPSGLADGPAVITLNDESGRIINVGFTAISNVSPSIFTANSNGQGVPAAIITRVKPDNTQVFEPVAQFDEAQGRFVPIALDLGPESEFVVLSLFGTGFRQVGSIAEVEVKIGGVNCPVEYAGKQPTIEGLDQINVRLPRSLVGKEDVTVVVKVGFGFANSVQLKIR